MAPKAKVKVSVKPKCASARPDTSSAKSKPATTGGSPAISAEAREEIERLVEQVFKLCDADHGGSIQFTEFLVQHRLIVELAAGYLDDGAAPKGLLDTEEAEENFRKLDADNDLQLNKVEFNKYMDGVLSVIGFRNFTEICKGLIDKKDEFQRKGKKLREGFDLGKSSLLLDTVRSAGNLSEGTGGFINVMKLLSGKADPNFEDQDGCNAVVLAAGRACPVMLTKLIEANADPTVSSPSGDCAVFRAAASQNFLALKFLLVAPKVEAESAEKGEQAEKDEKGEKGEKGQKADIRRNSLRSPRPGTQQGRRPSTRQGGPQEDEDLDKLSETLVTTMPDLSGNDVAELLRRKANVNHKSSSGWTPLTMATFLGKKDCVETLLRALGQLKRARAWVNGRNLKGRTALHVAGRKAEAGPIIPVLLRAGADPDLQDNDGWTALHHAAFNGIDANVLDLIKGGSSVMVRGRNGYTPWMTTFLPSRAGQLGKEARQALEPSEAVQFKYIVQELNKEELCAYERLAALQKLPGVCSQLQNLRLYEQYFPSHTGPNKVRLQKVWEKLAAPMIRRLRTRESDMEEPGPHLDPGAAEEVRNEIESRLREQKAFVHAWLVDTKGPKRTEHDWNFDNRACFEEEMRALIDEELGCFEKELNKLYDALLEKEGGSELAALPEEEVLESRYLTQLGAHAIPVWLEELDGIGAFQALWNVGAGSIERDDDDDDAAFGFLELLANEPELAPGPIFWRNSYAYWLHHYCAWAETEFHQTIIRALNKFNEDHPELQQDEDGNEKKVTYRRAPLKTYEQIKRKERTLGTPSHESFAGRTLAAGILDIVRGSITVDNPRAVVALVKWFKTLKRSKDRIELVRIKSWFHKDAKTEGGYRNLELNILWDGGERRAHHNGEVDLVMVAEVQINLDEYIEVKKRRHLLRKYKKGDFGYSPDEEQSGGGSLAED